MRDSRMTALLIGVIALASCNLDTTPPNELPHFSPAWQLVSVDDQALPDTLALALENSPPGTQHKIEAGAIQFVFPPGRRVLRWTLILFRLTDNLRFEFSFEADYIQIGNDSLQFPLARTVPPDFFGGKRADTLSIAAIWSGDSTTASTLVGGSHQWRFLRDTSFK